MSWEKFGHKVCPGCGKNLPATFEYFYRVGNGMFRHCKKCEARRASERYRRDIELSRAKSRERGRKWRAKNPELQKSKSRRSSNKALETPRGKLSHAISSGVLKSIKGRKNARWESVVGYTIEDLMTHLESQFTKGMTWDNYGVHGWHIDHIRPISHFNFDSPDDSEFLECWSLWNLQPMWGKENISKLNRCNAPPLPLIHKEAICMEKES